MRDLARARAPRSRAAFLACLAAIAWSLAAFPPSGQAQDAASAPIAILPEPGAAHAMPAATAPAAAASAAPGVDPRALAIQAAVESLRVDPLLSGRRKTHTLKWNPGPSETKARWKIDASWGEWILAFARFLNDTSRLLVYGIAIVLVALLLVSLRHLFQLRATARRVKTAPAVSHVRDLDVRPESLPDDIGAAAWALWQAERVPAALSLLYRGALSRLIHRHAVPIEASTTEGECVDLAHGRLDPAAHRYLAQVVRAWEANIYGNRTLSAAMGEALCGGFATRLDTAPAAGAPHAATPRAGAAS